MFNLVVANLHDDPKAVAQVAELGDYVMANEARARAHVAIVKLVAAFAFFLPKGGPAQNPHLWRRSKLAGVSETFRLLMDGGRIGLAKARVSARVKARYRKRRLGPGRYATAVLVRELDSGHLVLMVCIHLVARTQTSERWRWPVMLLSQANLRLFLRGLARRHPGVPQIVGGDTNLKLTKYLNLGAGWVAVPTPADMGANHYTQVHFRGPISVSHPMAHRTASDHKAITCQVTFHADAPTLHVA